LQCNAVGNPPVEVYLFYANDQLIEKSKTGKLTIKASTVGNTKYRCQPMNKLGLGENATVEVNIKGIFKIVNINIHSSI